MLTYEKNIIQKKRIKLTKRMKVKNLIQKQDKKSFV